MGSFSVFPALAGVILQPKTKTFCIVRFSRTRGGDPDCCFFVTTFFCFSRTRGGDPGEERYNSLENAFFPHSRG